VDEELEAVADTLGPAVVLTGFYSHGEIGPLASGGRSAPSWGGDASDVVSRALASLPATADAEPAPALPQALPGLLERVGATYDQHDRDLDLRFRSLELTSDEMTARSRRLADQLASRKRASASLDALVSRWLPDVAQPDADGSDRREHLSGLLTRLVGKREAGRQALANQKFALSRRAYPQGLEPIPDLPPDPPGQLLGDPGRIRQVRVNRVGNAIEFTPQGDVTVRLQWLDAADGECVAEVSVRDTGIGIPPDKQAVIVDAFSQADASTTRHCGGTGLGPSISSRLVALMGGRRRWRRLRHQPHHLCRTVGALRPDRGHGGRATAGVGAPVERPARCRAARSRHARIGWPGHAARVAGACSRGPHCTGEHAVFLCHRGRIGRGEQPARSPVLLQARGNRDLLDALRVVMAGPTDETRDAAANGPSALSRKAARPAWTPAWTVTSPSRWKPTSCSIAWRRRDSAQADARGLEVALDQLDLVAIRVRHEGDHRGAALDRPWLARDIAPRGADPLARRVGVGNADGDMAVGGAHLVGLDAPVVGQLDLGLAGVAPVKAQEGQRVLVLGVFGGAQQLHAEHLGVEVNGTLQVAHPQHGVEDAHDRNFY